MNPDEPSRTALVVAKSQVLVGRSPETAGLVPADTLEFVERALQVTGRRRFPRLVRHAGFRRLIQCYERLMIPGLALHHALRKQAVECIVRRELAAGAAQVIQIGAGFDSLAYRLHREFPNADFVERDHPATQQAKQVVIDGLEGSARNLILQPIDLAAAGTGIALPNPTRRSIVIIEGVLMYLDPDTVKEHLRHLRDQLGPNSLLLFSFMDSPGFHRQSPLVSWWLRAGGEPFRWSLPTEQLADFLGAIDLVSHAVHVTNDRPGIGQDVATGELLCEARPVLHAHSTDKAGRGEPLPVAACLS